MPIYDYQCLECGKVIEASRVMAHRDCVPDCPECKIRTKRLIRMPAINWNGLKPSQGELPLSVQDMVNHEDENRDNYLERKETT